MRKSTITNARERFCEVFTKHHSFLSTTTTEPRPTTTHLLLNKQLAYNPENKRRTTTMKMMDPTKRSFAWTPRLVSLWTMIVVLASMLMTTTTVHAGGDYMVSCTREDFVEEHCTPDINAIILAQIQNCASLGTGTKYNHPVSRIDDEVRRTLLEDDGEESYPVEAAAAAAAIATPFVNDNNNHHLRRSLPADMYTTCVTTGCVAWGCTGACCTSFKKYCATTCGCTCPCRRRLEEGDDNDENGIDSFIRRVLGNGNGNNKDDDDDDDDEIKQQDIQKILHACTKSMKDLADELETSLENKCLGKGNKIDCLAMVF